MQQHLVFEEHAVSGSLADVALELALNSPPTRESICHKMFRMPEAASRGCDVLILDSPVMYWMCGQGEPCSKTRYRQFARGSTLVCALETATADCDVEATIVWPYQQVLAGECQFAQLMRTIFGNFSETGFDANSFQPVPHFGSKLPVLSAPADMRVPKNKRRKMSTNVEMRETAFLTEALCSEPNAGFGRRLAEVRLWNAKVQHVLLEGVFLNNFTCHTRVKLEM
jgi:hypothetical protein